MSTEFYIILPNDSSRAVALASYGGTYALPHFRQNVEVRYNTVTGINDALASKWNLNATVSRCVREGDDTNSAIFAMHNHDPRWQPKPAFAQWVDYEQIKDLQFENEEHRKYLLEWFDSLQDDAWKHVPWSSPDWSERACRWMREAVAATGATILAGPSQVRAWAISSIWKIKTSTGTLYFKAVPDFFGHAPVLEQYLSEHFPDNLIEIVAIEPDQHWMLSREWAGENPSTAEHWQHILRMVTGIQLHCKDSVDELLSFGCKDRRLAKIPELVQPIFDDLKNAEMLEIYGVDLDEAEELSTRLKSLPALCENLSNFGLPETLIHGDLWGNNVIYRDEISGKSPVIFDWTDASITHPFIDIYLLLTSEPDLSMRPVIRQIFIDIWSEHFSREAVESALEVAEQVAPFYFMLAFRTVQISAPKQSRWELAFLFKRFVRNILLIPKTDS